MSRMPFLTRALVLFHDVPPSWSSRGARPSMPLYFWIKSSLASGSSSRLPEA